jgi:hypothetical protein
MWIEVKRKPFSIPLQLHTNFGLDGTQQKDAPSLFHKHAQRQIPWTPPDEYCVH